MDGRTNSTPNPTKNTTIGTCVFRVDMTFRAGTLTPFVTIANKDIRQGVLGPTQNNTRTHYIMSSEGQFTK